MTTYDNNMRGTLGKNNRREKETHPEYTGQCEIDGVGYWISAWIKEGQGSKFFSLSFKPKEQQAAPPLVRAAGAQRPNKPEPDSDIPF
jgi:hypothetical protein